jgi:hypothetical protein
VPAEPSQGRFGEADGADLDVPRKEWVICYEWFERRKAKEALETGKEQAESFIKKIKAAAQHAPNSERRPVVEKEKGTV